MSMYCTGMLLLQRNAPLGMRCTSTITLLHRGEMRSDVCGAAWVGRKGVESGGTGDAHQIRTQGEGARLDVRSVHLGGFRMT